MNLLQDPENAQGRRSATLVSEANHRIANSLAAIAAIIRLEASDPQRVQYLRSPAEVRNFLAEIGLRIETAAQLHRLLAESDHGAEVELSDYLLKIADLILAANAWSGAANLTHDLTSDCAVPSDQALAVGLIVAELITNALKYAHPAGVSGRIRLKCVRSGDGVRIEVADDGVGLPEGFNPEAAPSLGFRLMRALSRQLGAKLCFDQTGLGLSVTLETGALKPAH